MMEYMSFTLMQTHCLFSQTSVLFGISNYGIFMGQGEAVSKSNLKLETMYLAFKAF